MTKDRAPISIDGALARIAGLLPGGWAEMARITDYNERTVRSWGDVDRDEQINLPAAIKLDLAYLAAGGQEKPLYETYGYQLGLSMRERFADQFDILRLAADVVREVGEAQTALLEASLPDATQVDRREAQREILEAMEVMKRAMLELERREPPRATAPP